jgi:hypothetical protein
MWLGFFSPKLELQGNPKFRKTHEEANVSAGSGFSINIYFCSFLIFFELGSHPLSSYKSVATVVRETTVTLSVPCCSYWSLK